MNCPLTRQQVKQVKEALEDKSLSCEGKVKTVATLIEDFEMMNQSLAVVYKWQVPSGRSVG